MLAPLGGLRERRGVSVRVVAVRRAGGRGRPRHPAGGLLARLVALGQGRRRRRPGRHGRAGSARRRPGPRRRARRRARARLRLLRGLGPEMAVRPERPRLPVRTRRARDEPPGPVAAATATWPTRRARSSSSCSPTRAASRSASRRPTRSTGRWPRSTCSSRPGWLTFRPRAIDLAAHLAERLGSRVRPRGRLDARVLGGGRARGRGRAARRGGLRGARPAGDRDRARLGRRMVERGSSSTGSPSSLVAEDHDAEDDRGEHHGHAERADRPVDDRPGHAALAARARSRASLPRIASP